MYQHKKLYALQIWPECAFPCMWQAKAWLSWEHSVSSSRTSSLQVWSGSQWQQTDFPNPDSGRPRLPLPPPQPAAAAPAGPPSQSAPASNGGSRHDSSSTEQAAQPPPISTFTAQALLECHYSHNAAFLQDPLLQVSSHLPGSPHGPHPQPCTDIHTLP